MSEPTDSTLGGPSSWDDIDELLLACLDAPGEAVHDRLEAACEKHPEFAPVLRRRIATLERFGFDESTRWHADPKPGMRFGDYVLLERIGGGGMGVVYRARQESLGREVALKLLRGGMAEDESFRQRFLREARSVSGLSHASICRILDLGEHDGIPFFSMELIEGKSLAELLRADRKSKTQASTIVRRELIERVTWLRNIALALQEAHGAGLVHRDVKPSNILIDERRHARLIDFGLAHDLRSAQGLTLTGDMLGTPGYMAPEQLVGESKRVGPETDVFGLGATLYELLTLQRPHASTDRVEQIQSTLRDPPTDPRSLNPRLDIDLCAVLERALEKDPTRRYRSAAEFAAELDRWLNGIPVLARRPSRLRRSWRWIRRNPLPTALGLVLLSASLVVGYFLRESRLSLRHSRALAMLEAAREAQETGRPATAVRLAYAAYRGDPNATTLGALQRAVATVAPSDIIETGWQVWFCRASKDGNFVAGAGQGGRGILARSDGAKIAELPTQSTKLWFLSFSPSNDLLIGGTGEARVFDATGQRRIAIPTPEGCKSFAAGCFDISSERVLLGDEKGRVHLFRVRDGALLRSFDSGPCPESSPYNAVLQLEAHPDGKRFLSFDYAGNVLLRDVEDGSILQSQEKLPAITDGFLAGKEHELVCFADRHGLARLWNLKSDEQQVIGNDPLAWNVGIAASPDGRHVAVCGYGQKLEIYDDEGRLHAALTHTTGIWDCDFSPDGTQIAYCTDDGLVRVCDLGGALLRELRGHQAGINQLCWLPDGRSIVTACQDGTLRIWRLGEHELPILTGHDGDIVAAMRLPNGDLLSGDLLGRIHRWSEQGEKLATIHLRGDRMQSMVYDDDRDEIYVTHAYPYVTRWSGDGTWLPPVLRLEDDSLGAYPLTDGRVLLVLVGSNDERVTLSPWKLSDGPKWIPAGEPLRCPSELGRADATSLENGILTILHKRGVISQFDIRAQKPRLIWRGAIDGRHARILLAAPDGHSLLLCGEDGVLRLFEPGQGIQTEFHGHQRAVTWACFSPDGKRVVSAGRDGTVRVWTRDGVERMTLRSSHGTAHVAAFSRDGRKLVVGYSGRILREWYLEAEDVISAAKRIVDSLELTAEEQLRYAAILGN